MIELYAKIDRRHYPLGTVRYGIDGQDQLRAVVRLLREVAGKIEDMQRDSRAEVGRP